MERHKEKLKKQLATLMHELPKLLNEVDLSHYRFHTGSLEGWLVNVLGHDPVDITTKLSPLARNGLLRAQCKDGYIYIEGVAMKDFRYPVSQLELESEK
jgi:hypothetical protein